MGSLSRGLLNPYFSPTPYYPFQLSETVQRVLKTHKQCVNLGGDHSLGIGSVYGHSLVHPKLSLLWIDAHADLNTAQTSPTGNIHGMSCSFLLNELKSDVSPVPGFEWMHPVLSCKNLAYIGLRELDDQETNTLKKYGIPSYSMTDLDRYGIFEVVNRAMEQIDPQQDRSLHVSFDIDSVDKSLAPSTGTPVPGGMSLREALYIAEEIYKTGRLHVLDLVEVNPSIGTESDVRNTVDAACRIVAGFFGKERGGNLPVERAAVE
ncbi:ARG2 (predicted) [Pycnogonum litorale]